jgi:hypothetical protein
MQQQDTQMFEELVVHSHILVTGPQRSGTRICTKMIAVDTGHEYLNEGVMDIHNVAKAKQALTQKNVVLHGPGAFYMAHTFPEEVLVVVMMRHVDDIVASQKRINWSAGGSEARERHKYRRFSTTGPTAKIKYDYWFKVQRPQVKNYREVVYETLCKHPMWVPKEKRLNFLPGQTEC